MDIKSRILRRQHRDGESRLIQNYESLSPVAHIEEPADRGPILERLLDHLDPVFEGHLPPNAYLYGPKGSGKSAVVRALFTHLEQLPSQTQTVIHTSTRAQLSTSPTFVYVDARQISSEFAFYHAILDTLTDETVPEHGVGTATLRQRLHELLADDGTGVVVAIDHADETRHDDGLDFIGLFAGLPSTVSWLAIGRNEPNASRFTDYTATSIHVEAYQRQMLVDIVMTRASTGLAQQALDHGLARDIAEWADGDAHDALALLFILAVRAEVDGRYRLAADDIEEATAEIPLPCVSLARVLALPQNRQTVLRELVDLGDANLQSVTKTTEAISARPSVDLSPGTVKRYLYEMAEDGIVRRVQAQTRQGQGRPPSRVEPRFPPTVFRKLYDLSTP